MPCRECGATFAIDEIRPVVHCPFCGRRQEVPEELRQALARYAGEVNQRMAQADEAQRLAAAARAWAESPQSSARTSILVVYGFTVGGALLVSLVGFALTQAGALGAAGSKGFAFAAMGTSYAGILAWLVWMFATRKKARHQQVTVDSVKVACPICGAPGALTPGDQVDKCAYCQSALIPSRTVMSRAVGAVRIAQRQAAMERYRQERIVMMRQVAPAFAVHGPMLLSFALPIAALPVATLWYSAKMLAGSEPFRGSIAVGWVVSLVLATGTYLWWRTRRDRQAEWRRALAHLATQLRGGVGLRLEELLEWLNSYWPAPYHNPYLRQGYYTAVVSGEIEAYPAFVLVNPAGALEKNAFKVDVFLAADVPEGGGEGLARELDDMGLDAETTPAGFLARARPETVKAWHRNPESAHVLALVLGRMVRFAQRNGASPASAALP
jgi:DNA-directed RNA polymerase subunit RPC12/RpoP